MILRERTALHRTPIFPEDIEKMIQGSAEQGTQ